MTFRIGQKVVCIETWPSVSRYQGPVAGQIYTIRHVGIGLHLCYPNKMHVRLVELVNPICNALPGMTFEPAFRASRFRPLVERKTDISIFTAMLDRAGQRVEA